MIVAPNVVVLIVVRTCMPQLSDLSRRGGFRHTGFGILGPIV